MFYLKAEKHSNTTLVKVKLNGKTFGSVIAYKFKYNTC